MQNKILGKLVGNTGDPTKLTMVMSSSFSGRRGEFVRIQHKERKNDPYSDVLGRIVSIKRSNVLYNAGMGNSVNDLELMPGANITGENLYATIELVGFKDPETNRITMPRRPLNPGEKVKTVDYQFLSNFYEFKEQTSLHLGNLIGYDRGDNIVPVFLDVATLVTEHIAVLAMTGAGKSYTVGRIIERLVAQFNATVVVMDPHGEYGKALRNGNVQFNETGDITDPRDQKSLPEIQQVLQKLTDAGAGIQVYTPQDPNFRGKYASKNLELALEFDKFEMDDISEILPGLTEPQQRVLDVAIRYWRKTEKEPRDINRLRELLGDDLPDLQSWEEITEAEAKALNGRSAAVASMKLRRVLMEAKSFYHVALPKPTSVHSMVGKRGDTKGRMVIIDQQGLSDTAKQVITALVSSEILRAASSKTNPIRPTFIIYEEGHTFAPAKDQAISLRIIKKVAGEGRKFGVGFAIVSQRPSKLDSDVTSQCNTIVAMRLKNPDDQRFILKVSDMFSQADVNELPSLSTGEALISGRSIPAPLLVKIGNKALLHGGESPKVLDMWGSFDG